MVHLHGVTFVSALHFATLSEEILAFVLLFARRRKGRRLHGETALHWAVNADRERVVSLLLASGAQRLPRRPQQSSGSLRRGHFHLLSVPGILVHSIALLQRRVDSSGVA